MHIKQLRYVTALAREGSFPKAAAALNMTQASLSQFITEIAQELGHELFDQSNVDVELTDARLALVDVDQKMLVHDR